MQGDQNQNKMRANLAQGWEVSDTAEGELQWQGYSAKPGLIIQRSIQIGGSAQAAGTELSPTHPAGIQHLPQLQTMEEISQDQTVALLKAAPCCWPAIFL